VAAPVEVGASDPGWPQTLLRNVEEWNSPTGELTPLSALGCLPAQVKLTLKAG